MLHASTRWPRPLACAVAAAGLVLAGCGTKPPVRTAGGGAPVPSAAKGGGYYKDDGPAAEVPADLARTPDAEPRVEPLAARGPNKPYSVLGRDYTPLAADVPMKERGRASWYGRKFHGKRTASGEIYNMHAMTAAHPTMPIPSYARVRHVASGREVIVRVNDRGPFHSDRVIDLSYTAALKLGFIGQGSAVVEVERITHDEIRAGTWRRGGEAAEVAAAPAPAAPAATPAAAVAQAGSPPASPTQARAQGAPPRPPDVIATFAAAAAPEPSGPAVADAPPAAAATSAAQGYWVQLGAFRQREGAESFHRRVSGEADWLAPLLAIFSESPLFRLQAGPYPSRDEAVAAAQRVRDVLRLVPSIVERR